MSEIPRVGAFAIVPSNDLAAAIPFWVGLGFSRTGGDINYLIMTGWGCEVHLTQAGTGPWRVPAENNPFGVFIRTPDVDAIAALAVDLIIRPGGMLRHREWGLYAARNNALPYVGRLPMDSQRTRSAQHRQITADLHRRRQRRFTSFRLWRHPPSDVGLIPQARA